MGLLDATGRPRRVGEARVTGPVPGDPPVRADGLCRQCGGPRRLDGKGKLHRAEAAQDPFCSNDCCRLWYSLERVNDDAEANAARGRAMRRGKTDPYLT